MKKLMIALAVVAMATCSQAAVYQWKVGTAAQRIYKPGTTSTGVGAISCYLFSANDYDQGTLLTAITATGIDTTAKRANLLATKAIDNQTLSSTGAKSGVTTLESPKTLGTTTEIEGNNFANNYIAVLLTVDDKDYLYLSGSGKTLIPGEAQEEALYTAGAQDASKNAAFDYGKSFAEGGAGWYTLTGGASPIPEPTSGLLLLLGVAGLALRRKQK